MATPTRKIAPLVVLIDPDDRQTRQLMDEIIRYRDSHNHCDDIFEIWVGCSNSPGSEVRKVAQYLRASGVSCSVYPGNPEQVRETLELAARYFLPDPLLHDHPELIERMKKLTLEYLGQAPAPREYSIMTYILLNPFCSTAKVFRLNDRSLDHEIFGDDNVLRRLSVEKQRGEPFQGKVIYLEGGSRVKKGGIVSRLGLAKKIKEAYPEAHVLGAGGITGVRDLVTLLQAKCLDTILVSGTLHQSPSALPDYIETVDFFIRENN